MMTLMDETTARYQRFLNSSVAKEHTKIRDEIIAELHLEFELRDNGMHAVCAQCRRSVAQLTQLSYTVDDTGLRLPHHASYAHTLENMATLYMAHFMNMHYEREGRRG